MTKQKSKNILGMTYLQIGILAGLGIFLLVVIGCFGIMLMYSIRPASQATKIVSIPTTMTKTFTARYGTPPDHKVNDYWDNGKGTNFAYFIVADKSLTREDAETIITHYLGEHRGFKLINIYIYCDARYADVQYWDAMDYSGGLGDEVFKYIMFWYQSGEWSSSGRVFMTESDVDYPTFGMNCK